MAKSATQLVMNYFDKSSEDNKITSLASKIKQAVSSGPSYRASLDSTARNEIHNRCKSELMRPYQDTYREQIPAVLLAVADKVALKRVAVKKLTSAKNELALGMSLLAALDAEKEANLDTWNTFKENLTSKEVATYEGWLEKFSEDTLV
jgi:hypothetical protein